MKDQDYLRSVLLKYNYNTASDENILDFLNFLYAHSYSGSGGDAYIQLPAIKLKRGTIKNAFDNLSIKIQSCETQRHITTTDEISLMILFAMFMDDDLSDVVS